MLVIICGPDHWRGPVSAKAQSGKSQLHKKQLILPFAPLHAARNSRFWRTQHGPGWKTCGSWRSPQQKPKWLNQTGTTAAGHGLATGYTSWYMSRISSLKDDFGPLLGHLHADPKDSQVFRANTIPTISQEWHAFHSLTVRSWRLTVIQRSKQRNPTGASEPVPSVSLAG